MKANRIGQCAAQIVKRRRTSVNRFRLVFIGLIFSPVILHVLIIFLISTPSMPALGFGMSSLAGLALIPTMIDLKASQSRLETLLTIWLLSNDEEHSDRADLEFVTEIVALDS